ncbi:family 1 glycosylhydrolase, partial [bacterium]|nr:family 1 glycosylhydrolase [bacterium]
DNGIEPYITLHHFVCPKWFKDSGGFDNLDNVEIFKNHSLRMMELFPEVTYWMPFNEINVDGFQKCVRGVYPPGNEGNIAAAGRMMRNMLIAHCLLYKEAKERWPDLKIGSTHQWLKFEPLNGNLLEEAICHFLSKITHYACYDFFKNGQFSLEMPGVSNVQFSIPREEFEKYRGFSDFLGVQFYGFPRLMASFNGGKDYPGYGIQNFNLPSLGLGLTFGSTCPPGGIAQSFGPSFYPESLDKCLSEAVEVVKLFPGKTLVITETGCDARVWKFGEKGWTIDDQVQKEYFERIFPILEKFKEHVSGFLVWTLADGQEWERADTPILNLGKMHKIDGKIQRYEPYPAAER